MKRFLIFLLSIFTFIFCSAQSKKIGLDFRVPLQIDFQEDEVVYSWGNKSIESTAVNFGLDALATCNYRKLDFFAGIGFFRNRFNLVRPYNHRTLDPAVDSLPYGAATQHYSYSLLRLPVGFSISCLKIGGTLLSPGAEWIPNFSFRSRYKGHLPVANTNEVINEFGYYGSLVNVFVRVLPKTKRKQISIEPFVRVYNIYRKDRIFFEDESQNNKRYFDAFGVNFRFKIL